MEILSNDSLRHSDEPSSGDTEEEDDERDSSSSIRPIRKSIITTRAQAAARSNSHNRRKSSPPKKRSSLLPPHRPNTRISRRIIEQDLKLLRQANVLPPLSPPSNQQPLDLSLGPSNRSSSFEEVLESSNTKDDHDTVTTKSTTPIEGVLDLSLSRWEEYLCVSVYLVLYVCNMNVPDKSKRNPLIYFTHLLRLLLPRTAVFYIYLIECVFFLCHCSFYLCIGFSSISVFCVLFIIFVLPLFEIIDFFVSLSLLFCL